jgi:Type II secretion system (T2SS), protein K
LVVPICPGAYDGGLIDLNHAPAEVVACLPSFDVELADRVVTARERIDGFSSIEDFGTVLDLPAARLSICGIMSSSCPAEGSRRDSRSSGMLCPWLDGSASMWVEGERVSMQR